MYSPPEVRHCEEPALALRARATKQSSCNEKQRLEYTWRWANGMECKQALFFMSCILKKPQSPWNKPSFSCNDSKPRGTVKVKTQRQLLTRVSLHSHRFVRSPHCSHAVARGLLRRSRA